MSYPMKWRKNIQFVGVLLVLLASNACQSLQTPSAPTQSLPSETPIIESTSTEPAVLPLFSVIESPTATVSPTATETAATLTPNGPWLVYLRYGLTIVNQDGTGRTIQGKPDEIPSCNWDTGVGIHENPLNHLVVFPRTIYLVQPEPTWSLIYREWPTCHTDFTGDEKGGLLAGIDQSTADAIPELRIYELPSGKFRDHFPLMKCSKQCNTDNVNWWEIKWSPNGRYLAFPAALEGDSSDLYIYDSGGGNIRRLTTGPDHVGPIWWSPDGSTIIMSEISKDGGYPYVSSVWAVSLRDGDIKLLYSLDDPYPQGLLGWLDNDRFITFGGTSLANALDLPAIDLRLVDKVTGKVTLLFNGGVMMVSLDQAHETVVVLAWDGIYLISTSNPEPELMKGIIHMPWWDDEVGLFVADEPCENDPTGRKAFDYKGEWQCVHREMPEESLSSPVGKWQVILQDGFWLKSNEQTVQVVTEIPTQIIWRLDSQGLFFIANYVLYYTPLPNVNVTMVDKYPGGDTIDYQWVGGD